MTADNHLTRWPINRIGSIYSLEDRKGERISWHRTLSGALRARRKLIEQQLENAS